MRKSFEGIKNKEGSGFSLIESLITMSLFLLVVLATMEFYAFTRGKFQKVKEEQEASEAAFAALDKMKTDLAESGLGIIIPVELGVLDAISESNGTLIILSREKQLMLSSDLVPGQIRINLASTSKIRKGRELCFFDPTKAEIKAVFLVDRNSVVLSSPIDFSYSKEDCSVIMIKRVSLFFDESSQTLRRKVNSSSAQPLLEETAFFGFDYNEASNLLKLSISLKTNKEKKYEISVFPENVALVSALKAGE